MEPSVEKRKPPRVVFVAPPAATTMLRRLHLPVWLGLIALVVGLIAGVSNTALLGVIVGGTIFIAYSAIFLGVSCWMGRYQRRIRTEFGIRHPGWDSDPLAREYAHAWKTLDRLPQAEIVRKITEATPDTDDADGRARVVCFGHVEIPEVGELYFEPEIITPTHRIWWGLWLLVLALAFAALWILDRLGWLSFLMPQIRWSMFGALLAMAGAGSVVLVIWIYSGMIRPTYVRMAPGIIQVLVFDTSNSKPAIRSYPMTAGTVVYFSRFHKHFFMTLLRDDWKDTLPLASVRDARRVTERAFQAIFSVAPIPPLNDAELLG